MSLAVFFQAFEELEIKKEISKKAFEFVQEKGILPNDALILACCKEYNIECFLSFDPDFENPCKEEKINLVDKIEAPEQMLKEKQINDKRK